MRAGQKDGNEICIPFFVLFHLRKMSLELIFAFATNNVVLRLDVVHLNCLAKIPAKISQQGAGYSRMRSLKA